MAWPSDALREELKRPKNWNFGLFNDERKLIGYLLARPDGPEVHLVNIAIDPDYQKKGCARMLLNALIEKSKLEEKALIHLEVRAINKKAIALYKSFDFQDVFYSEHLYQSGKIQDRPGHRMTLVFKP